MSYLLRIFISYFSFYTPLELSMLNRLAYSKSKFIRNLNFRSTIRADFIVRKLPNPLSIVNSPPIVIGFLDEKFSTEEFRAEEEAAQRKSARKLPYFGAQSQSEEIVRSFAQWTTHTRRGSTKATMRCQDWMAITSPATS